ncbi:MAG TPA: GAF domain-containing protein, partial [Acidobacteriota bacterium]
MELVAVAAANMRGHEEQSRQQLNAITRLTLLYDISQIFNSTLELNQLLPIITEKIRDILDAETCTIWFVNEAGEAIVCGKSTGSYEEIFRNFSANLAEDIAGHVVQQGEGVLLEDASQEESLLHRFTNPEETPVYTYLAAPLECKGVILGTLEIVNRLNENPYNEEDQFLLNDLSHQAAISISNANLLETERKAKELDALLNISREITSTLNLDKVLLTIVNQAVTLIPYDRAAIALIDRGKVELRAVSGRIEVDRNSTEIKDLDSIVVWAAHLGKGLYISEFQGQIATDREEDREKFKIYFEKSNMKSFISIPLKDEEGDLGLLTFESAVPYFLDERHLEVASILANQATVAIRNAQLYRQVPLINIMEPLMERKARLMKMPKSRRIAWGVGTAIVLLLLTVVPWNMKVTGDATVIPANRTPVVAEVEGIVKDVVLREGAETGKGTTIATLDDMPFHVALGEQKTRRDVLVKEVSRSQSVGDSSTVRQKQIELEQAMREIDFYQKRLNLTRIVSPVDGILITPKIEEKVGQFLKKGEEFCEVADMRSTKAQVTLGEGDISYLHVGQRVRLKMNAFPTRKFYGTVTLLGAQITPQNDTHYYRLEA